jgi:hypothetical protein
MSAPKNYTTKSLNKSDDEEIYSLVVTRFSHLTNTKALRAARELVALRKFNRKIAESAR